MNLRLNVALLRKKVPNLTVAAKEVGLRPATVSNLCTGKIPLEKAEVQTLVKLASLANCLLDDLVLSDDKLNLVETGIKAIDFFAPLKKGSVIGLLARKEMGQLILVAEVFLRLKKQGFKTMLLHSSDNVPGLMEVQNESEMLASSKESAVELIDKNLVDEDLIILMDRAHVLAGDLTYIKEHDTAKNLKSLTVVLVDLRGEAVDEDLPFGPLDMIWSFDMELVAKKYYPAIHPLFSFSDESLNESKDLSVQKQVQKYIRRYREMRILYSQKGFEFLPKEEESNFKKGERLEAFFTQPFYIAELYTKKEGETVPHSTAMKDIKEILAGRWNHLPLSHFTNRGSLEGDK
ncbi:MULTISPECIES: hypothetical protein [Bacillaceae]|uniref:F-type H+-transporting ATPase subunit beta n=1 Tax=Alkalicoccobacillus plakortidis TaxID=444060 RepID=A0A9D5I1K7_9BACI|nr:MULTISPECIES: hypothetical protein [Bacillaceae]KQL57805.1 hypothetical protein AN965_05630 [Alkalicoccobacillus plakortidis]